MKSKKQTKTNKNNKTDCVNCKICKYYNGNCTHKSNIGIRVRQETEFFVKPAKELEAECKNYAKT